jgi:hypothetical protein
MILLSGRRRINATNYGVSKTTILANGVLHGEFSIWMFIDDIAYLHQRGMIVHGIKHGQVYNWVLPYPNYDPWYGSSHYMFQIEQWENGIYMSKETYDSSGKFVCHTTAN